MAEGSLVEAVSALRCLPPLAAPPLPSPRGVLPPLAVVEADGFLEVLAYLSGELRFLGATMQPVSWQEMRCPKTGKIEKRKCAKPEDL